MISIGLRDVYNQLQDVSRLSGNLAAKLDTAVSAQTFNNQSNQNAIADLHRDIRDHEMRIRALELRPIVSPRAMWTGATVIISALGLFMVIIQIVLR